jgi:hypothetical protein
VPVTVKLLDFGIAGLLLSAGADPRQTPVHSERRTTCRPRGALGERGTAAEVIFSRSPSCFRASHRRAPVSGRYRSRDRSGSCMLQPSFASGNPAHPMLNRSSPRACASVGRTVA